ncbi:MAG: hypothetical protein LBJ46_07070 [Planctomycetota bacterium]|jgi:hypothetical protein|nr:hypothetical protein [Planctomycetota bacterium]
MFKKHLLVLFVAAIALAAAAGCGRRIDGPRFWWNDRAQDRLPEDYALPSDPAAPDELAEERATSASGDDLSEDDLRDYRTNLDQQEEKRKSESSIVDF